jgi:dTDP-4-dehydrorhamnose reductase
MNKKKKVLVTGASGYVGAAIYDYLKQNFEVFGTYHSAKLFEELLKMEITDEEEVKKVVDEIKPDFIIHAAANPNAKWCEANPTEAIKLNETGTENIVSAADLVGAKVIYISSYAAVINPNKLVYGKTKLAGEEITKKTKAGWVILRPAHIIGYSPNTTNDRQINRFLKNISEKKPVSYDNSWKFQPTELEHLSRIIEECIKRTITGEIIPVAAPELKTRFDLAKDIMTPFGIKVTPIDEKNNSPAFEQTLDRLKELNLPIVKYNEMMPRIIKDIKNNWINA